MSVGCMHGACTDATWNEKYEGNPNFRGGNTHVPCICPEYYDNDNIWLHAAMQDLYPGSTDIYSQTLLLTELLGPGGSGV